jgi:hypothetical protein
LSLRQVRKGHLAQREQPDQSVVVAARSDSEVLDAILISCQYIHVKFDRILEVFGDDGEEEEDEADG